jgi:hypothetical protein
MLGLPLAQVRLGGTVHTLDVLGLHAATEEAITFPTWVLLVLIVVVALVAIGTVLMYKNRILQIRLCIFNAIVMLGFYAIVAFLIWNLAEYDDFKVNLKPALAFPAIAGVLDYLAIRNIGADEVLVRSLERLR